ncbi:3-hydroxyacyl-ACP dehydratase FabZ [Bacillus safensis]|nr:3-hydroxyacyl-ACP dehydratase FabZ [Bacillus safensis]MCY1118911.1 3-hydroxyacyl-ACP dehydratase FabZ [Bacillus safensis]
MNRILDVNEIKKLLPHRWPFLMLDKVVELTPGIKGVGIKNVTISEPYFEGHFPNESIMPGVLIVEAMAQATAVVYCTGILKYSEETLNEVAASIELNATTDISHRVGYLVGIKDLKFLKPVVPGDQLRLKVHIERTYQVMSKVRVEAYVDKTCVAKGVLTVSQKPETLNPTKG